MDKLYKHLYEIFKEELIKLNIGYDFNIKSILYMSDLVNAIEYIKYAANRDDALKIIKLYDRCNKT